MKLSGVGLGNLVWKEFCNGDNNSWYKDRAIGNSSCKALIEF
jgi:hypothetical protein